VLSEIESEAAIKPSVKSSVGVDKQKLTTKPYITGAVVELTDKGRESRIRRLRKKYFKKILSLRLCWV
jgi:hypothetical protein